MQLQIFVSIFRVRIERSSVRNGRLVMAQVLFKVGIDFELSFRTRAI